ncbi:MAG: HAD family hydrolase [Lachnospiraceae bacterium]
MIKLVASDIDGTLVPEGTTSINPEFYEIIRKLKEKRNTFCGSQRPSVQQHAGPFGSGF